MSCSASKASDPVFLMANALFVAHQIYPPWHENPRMNLRSFQQRVKRLFGSFVGDGASRNISRTSLLPVELSLAMLNSGSVRSNSGVDYSLIIVARQLWWRWTRRMYRISGDWCLALSRSSYEMHTGEKSQRHSCFSWCSSNCCLH
jgi:hypothetical protein